MFYHAEAKQVKKNHFAYNNKLSVGTEDKQNLVIVSKCNNKFCGEYIFNKTQ